MRFLPVLSVFFLSLSEIVVATPTGDLFVNKKRSFDSESASLFRRVGSEFLGFHGTYTANAETYMKAGRAGKSLPVLSSGYNGADAELGPGLYATDHVETAMFFANTAANARKLKDKAVKPMVCGVEAIESEPWRTQVPKIWIPHDKVAKLVKGHNNPALLKDQESLITHAGFKVADTVRFSPLDIDNLAAGKPVVSGNQFSLPTTQFPKVYIRSCIDITGQTAAQVLAHFKQLGWPDRDFSSAQFRTDWHIHA